MPDELPPSDNAEDRSCELTWMNIGVEGAQAAQCGKAARYQCSVCRIWLCSAHGRVYQRGDRGSEQLVRCTQCPLVNGAVGIVRQMLTDLPDMSAVFSEFDREQFKKRSNLAQKLAEVANSFHDTAVECDHGRLAE